MADVMAVLGDLGDRGVIRLVKQPNTGSRPRSPKIEVHPALRIPNIPESLPEGPSGDFGDVYSDIAYERAERLGMVEA